MVKLRGILLGIVFTALAVGFAAAMPGAMRVSDVGSSQAKKETPKPDKSKAAEGSEEQESEVKEAEGSENEDPKEKAAGDNHGSVVSAIAKCDVKGRWHGEAVRSIAQDKDADLTDVAAACAAAQAAAAAAPPKGKPDHAGSNGKQSAGGKPDDTGKPAVPKVTKPAKPAASQSSSVAPTEPPKPADAGPPADKGNSKKP